MLKNNILIFFVILNLLACGKYEPPSQSMHEVPNIDAMLLSVDPQIAIIELEQRIAEMVKCTLTEEIQSTNELITQMKNKTRNQCLFSKNIISATKDTFNKIKKDGDIHFPLFAFNIYNDEFNERNETHVGLFSSEQECLKIEEQAREFNMITKRCFLWKNP